MSGEWQKILNNFHNNHNNSSTTKYKRDHRDSKTALICPVYKEWDRSFAANYRPIRPACLLSKNLEDIVTSHLMKYSERNSSMHWHEHGFTPGNICELQLIEITSDMAEMMDIRREQTKAYFLTLLQSLSKIDHHLLGMKIFKLRVCSKVCAWIAEFLSDRKQGNGIDDIKSDPMQVTSGVPYGSTSRTSQFLYYINEIPKSTLSTIRLLPMSQ